MEGKFVTHLLLDNVVGAVHVGVVVVVVAVADAVYLELLLPGVFLLLACPPKKCVC